MDFGNKIEMLRVVREETPFPAMVQSSPPSRVRSAVETVQEAKQHEFPVAPGAGAAAPAAAQKKKRSKPSVKKN
jgi:hypothetical protein